MDHLVSVDFSLSISSVYRAAHQALMELSRTMVALVGNQLTLLGCCVRSGKLQIVRSRELFFVSQHCCSKHQPEYSFEDIEQTLFNGIALEDLILEEDEWIIREKESTNRLFCSISSTSNELAIQLENDRESEPI